MFRRHDAGVDDSIVVERFKALGDPVRWAIVRELRTGTRCACELSDVADVSPPLLSHHLKVLREAGLIAGAKRGRWVDYTLDIDAVTALFALTELLTVK
jgi:ArsR family transcriptional regulator